MTRVPRPGEERHIVTPRLVGCDLATVARLEAFTMAAVPARTSWDLPGWWCVADDGGYVGRANSATSVPGHGTAPASLRAVAASYRERGFAPKVRWTPLTPSSLAWEAQRDGWVAAGEVAVMLAGPVVADDAGTDATAALVGTTSELDTPDAGWAGVYLAANADGSGPARLRLAVAAPEQKTYVTVGIDGRVAAIGLGVVLDGTLGIFDVVTAPQFRRKGFARQVVGALRRWGASRGAAEAFLQVHGGNAAAIALYGSLGFTTGYTYLYLVHGADQTSAG